MQKPDTGGDAQWLSRESVCAVRAVRAVRAWWLGLDPWATCKGRRGSWLCKVLWLSPHSAAAVNTAESLFHVIFITLRCTYNMYITVLHVLSSLLLYHFQFLVDFLIYLCKYKWVFTYPSHIPSAYHFLYLTFSFNSTSLFCEDTCTFIVTS